MVSLGRGLLAIGFGALHALWLLPALVALHLLQLLLSARAWRGRLPPARPLRRLCRLRIIRAARDSLLTTDCQTILLCQLRACISTA